MKNNLLLNNSLHDSKTFSNSNKIPHEDKNNIRNSKNKFKNSSSYFHTQTPYISKKNLQSSLMNLTNFKPKSTLLNFYSHTNTSSNISRKNNKSTNKTIFTKLTENLYKNLTNKKPSSNFNYEDFINDTHLDTLNNKTSNKVLNDKIINNFVARSTSKQKKIVACSRNKTFSFGAGDTKIKKVRSSTSSRSPEEFYTEQKLFLEKKENNLKKVEEKVRMEESMHMRDKPILTQKSMHIAEKNQKCKDVFTRLHNNTLNDEIEKELNSLKFISHSFSSQKLIDSNNKNNKKNSTISNNNISQKSKSISNNFYLRLTNQSTSPQIKHSTPTSKSPPLTSKESLCILLDKFLTSFELCIINTCNNNLHDISSSNTISKEQLQIILTNLHFIPNPSTNNLLEQTWQELITKSQTNSQMISLLTLLIFLLSVLGLLQQNLKVIPPYINNRLNGIITLNTLKQFVSKGKNISQINKIFQDMRNNYFNRNFYTSKESTSTNTPEHVLHKAKIISGKLSVSSLYDTYKKALINKEKKLNEKRDKKLQTEISQCTFSPDLSLTNKQNMSLYNQPRYNMSITARLYTDAQKKINQHNSRSKNININKCVDMKQRKSLQIKTPVVLNREMFEKNPLQSDRTIQMKCNMLKQARYEKREKNYYFTRGEPILNGKNKKDNNNKNDFVLYSNSDFEIAINVKYKQEGKSSRDNKDMNVKSFIIKKGENAFYNIDNFCKRYGLSEESKKLIIDSVKKKINSSI